MSEIQTHGRLEKGAVAGRPSLAPPFRYTRHVAAPKPGRQSPAGHEQRRAAGSAALLVMVIASSMQIGSALAVHVIGALGIVEALWLRTAIAALILA
ncbi:MAG: hypothetical protein WCP98_19325, partial [Actinomycetes bacterium]